MTKYCKDCNKKIGIFEDKRAVTDGGYICNSCLDKRLSKTKRKKEVYNESSIDWKHTGSIKPQTPSYVSEKEQKIATAKELNRKLNSMHGLKPSKENLLRKLKRKQKKKRRKDAKKKFDAYQISGVDEADFKD